MAGTSDVAADAQMRPILEAIAATSGLETSIRRRTEGLTWVIWGLVYAGYGMTVALAQATEGAGLGIGWGVAIGSWEILGVLASLGLWRSAALRLRADVSPLRATLFFAGWWLLFGVVQRIAAMWAPEGSGPVTALVAFGVLLAAFAAFDPLRFTPLGRRTAAVLSVIMLGAAAFPLLMPLDPPLALAFVGGVVGVSWTAAGLVALYRG